LAHLPEGGKIASLAISNQRETVLLWRRSTGRTIGPCVTWQCRRSSDRIDSLRTPEREARVAALTGLGLDPLFPAAKIGWLLDAYPEARDLAARGDLCAGTIDSWLLYNLTGGAVHATDASNASRTQLFDIHAQAWSAELAALFGVPMGVLPRPADSDALFGRTVALGLLPAGVPIRAMLGDSHAALFGHGVRAPGAVKATYGTGSSLMTLTKAPLASHSGLSTTVGWRRSGEVSFALEGNISVSAQAAAWMAELMGLSDVAALTELAMKSRAREDGVCFVPALAGLGAPYWKDRARAALTGMSLATRREESHARPWRRSRIRSPMYSPRWRTISAHRWRRRRLMAVPPATTIRCGCKPISSAVRCDARNSPNSAPSAPARWPAWRSVCSTIRQSNRASPRRST
jgi:glycerol kinase